MNKYFSVSVYSNEDYERGITILEKMFPNSPEDKVLHSGWGWEAFQRGKPIPFDWEYLLYDIDSSEKTATFFLKTDEDATLFRLKL